MDLERLSMTKSFLVTDIQDDSWLKFKRTVPRDVPLEDAIRGLIHGEVLERSADNRGRIRLGPDHADQDVFVCVVGENWE